MGPCDGSAVLLGVGLAVGFWDGGAVVGRPSSGGFSVRSSVGDIVGCSDGFFVICEDGLCNLDGTFDGCSDMTSVIPSVGENVGYLVGINTGILDGTFVGPFVGPVIGPIVGILDWCLVGGFVVGKNVGDLVLDPTFFEFFAVLICPPFGLFSVPFWRLVGCILSLPPVRLHTVFEKILCSLCPALVRVG